MTLMEAMKARHSVRKYNDRVIEGEVLSALLAEVEACNREGGLHIQLVTNEPQAFGGSLARYGSFSGVRNYFALVGRRAHDLSERCGYYGERLCLLAQTLGLKTCFVGLHYKKIKDAFKIGAGEKLTAVIAVGYGMTRGVPHKSKPIERVGNIAPDSPEWFVRGLEAALLAPTAMNQQKFYFERVGDTVRAKAGIGFYTDMDLGIAKYHFELGAGRDSFTFV